MPMNPRTLRPGNTFTPRSISGLALWLDAADGSSLYTTDAGPVTAVSSPLDISGCGLWLDASNAGSLTLNGNTVSEWRDLSGNARHFSQATPASQPNANSRTQNGRRVLDFAGAQSLNGNAASLSIATNVSGLTIFVVGQFDAIASTTMAMLSISRSDVNNSARAALVYLLGTNQILVGGRRLDADAFASAGYAPNTNTNVLTGTLDYANSDAFIWQGGATQASNTAFQTNGSTANADSLAVVVGSDGGATQGLDGFIAEVIVYPSALSTTDRARVEAYLAAKWGISGVHAQATATSDPVGYCADKSGNGRHLTQSIGASRPALRAATINGKRSLTFDGVDDNLWRSQGLTSDDLTMFCVYRYDALGGIVYDTGYTGDQTNANSSSIIGFLNSAGFLVNASGQVITRLDRTRSGTSDQGGFSSAPGSYSAGRVAIATAAASYGGASPVRYAAFDGAALTDSNRFNGTIWSTISLGCRRNSGATVSAASVFLAGQVCEFIAYDRNLPVAQRQRLERYLAAKWGITLAPQVSNADAQDWVNRVYANGGTVSSTTATAVNTFCNDIDAAGIRSLFYRANLFCGNADASLIAVRTPLYRGQSLGGTQFGGTLDTNVNFAITDYAETGTGAGTGGLKGDGSTKYLDTGFATNMLPAVTSRHVSAYEIAKSPNTNDASMGGSIGSSADGMILSTGNPASAYFLYRAGPNTFVQASSSYSGGAHWIGQNNAIRAGQIYKNGTLDASATAPGDCVNSAGTIGVFSWKYTDATTSWIFTSAVRLGGYSIGLSMTDPQAAAYYAAMQTFQTAMSRNA
jgi:hypothetical protein